MLVPVVEGIDLKRERIDRGYSIRGMAKALDVSPSVIHRVDEGKPPRIARHRYLIASFFGRTVTETWPELLERD
jgi:transcriptional regulator with XRE-family HTH domain